MLLNANGDTVAQAVKAELHISSYAAVAAGAAALSWAWTSGGTQAKEHKVLGGVGPLRFRPIAKQPFVAHQLVANFQHFWWQHVGLPLHFHLTWMVGLIKGLVQHSIFVFRESTRLAPKCFAYWLDNRSARMNGCEAHSLDFTPTEIEKLTSIGGNLDCLEAMVQGTGPCSDRVRKIVPDVFLVHFGALFGEQSSVSALEVLNRMEDLGTARALFGNAEDADWFLKPWKAPVTRSKPGLTFTLEKKYMRNGLFLYRTSAVIEDADIQEFCRYNLSLGERMQWDWTLENFLHIKDDDSQDDHVTSGVIFLESRMPGPLANREYCFARRIWKRSDGGCYCVCVSAPGQAPDAKGRNLRVEEFATAFVMRPTHSRQGRSTPAVEVASLYFDSPKMRSMAFNLAMKSGMWTAIQCLEENFRKLRAKPQQECQLCGSQEMGVVRKHKKQAILRGCRGALRGFCKVAIVVAFATMTKRAS